MHDYMLYYIFVIEIFNIFFFVLKNDCFALGTFAPPNVLKLTNEKQQQFSTCRSKVCLWIKELENKGRFE